MKKTILLISLTFLMLSTAMSQEKIQFGVKGGINFSNMTSDFLIEKEYKTGFHLGILAEIPFGAKFSLQPEILYSTQGVEGQVLLLYVPYPGAPTPPPTYSEYKLDYIQIPVLAKIYLIENLSLEIGPSFNFLVNDEQVTNSVTYTDNGSSFEFSGVLGVSYKIKNGLFGSFRYNKGFTDALDRVNYNDNAKNFGFQLGLGYLF